MRFQHIALGIFTVGVLVVAVGCPGAANPAKKYTDRARADRAAGKEINFDEASRGLIRSRKIPKVENPVTAMDQAKLLSGAGSVDDDAPKEFTTTDSGLKYRILRKSAGKKPSAADKDKVTVNYRGWLDNGHEFISSYKAGKPLSFSLEFEDIAKGWTEGIQLVSEGGMIELWIPSKLAYGARSGGPIPPNATLHYIVELKSIQ